MSFLFTFLSFLVPFRLDSWLYPCFGRRMTALLGSPSQVLPFGRLRFWKLILRGFRLDAHCRAIDSRSVCLRVPAACRAFCSGSISAAGRQFFNA